MSVAPQPSEEGLFPPDYWLPRCEGFRVYSPRGLIGVVEEVRFDSSSDRPEALAVRVGRFGTHRVLVPVAEIREVLVEAERIVLSASAEQRDQSPRRSAQATGVVTWFNESRRHGFIGPDGGGKDVFVLQKDLAEDGARTLVEGARVEFEPVDGAKGPEVRNVRPIRTRDPH